MTKVNRKAIKREILNYTAIFFGGLMASFSVACILIPNGAIDYGTAGIGILIGYLTGFNLSLCIFAVFIPFLIFSFFALGWQFFLKALWGSAVYTIGIAVFEEVPFELNTEHFIAVAFGGAIAGENKTLICYVNYFELGKIKNIISEHEGSFSTVSTIDEIIS